MTLDEKYRVHNRTRSRKTLLFYLLLLILLVFSGSIARYISDSSATFGMQVASWCIKINENEINKYSTVINDQMPLIVTENVTNDGLVKAGQKGYFDIKIDPQYTEVSLKYKIELDTSEIPSGIVLTSYSINDFSEKELMPTNKILEGNILLDGKNNLENNDVKIYRIYWEWPPENLKQVSIRNNYNIKANIKVEQFLEN